MPNINNHHNLCLYLHVPICLKKCNYCSFISYPYKNNSVTIFNNYINSICTEIHYRLGRYLGNHPKTIYIGGGTPTLLNIDQISQIVNQINNCTPLNERTEVTIEANPGTADIAYLKALKQIGINRISIGVQSLNDAELQLLGRPHNAHTAQEFVKSAYSIGITNLSIDLMYGLPQQTMNSWKDTLEKAVQLPIKHISAYGLKIEEGTHFAEQDNLDLPEEEVSINMYYYAIDFFKQHGFNHYEISNFAKEGFESKHNLTYWKNEEYLGFGVAAHGYTDSIRYSNTENIEEYINAPTKSSEEHMVTLLEKTEEAAFLGLRLLSGIDTEAFFEKHNVDFLQKHSKTIKKYKNLNLLEQDGNIIRLTREGLILSNSIFAEFLD